jgi:hypothetical protein
MSNEMKGFLTTLDLVTQNKIEPETVVEEDEIEETLIINEEGNVELLSELGDWKQAVNNRKNSERASVITPGKLDAAEEASKFVDDRYGPDAHSFVAAPPGPDYARADGASGDLGDVEGIPKVADVDAQTHAVDDYSSQHPVPATTREKLKQIPGWLWNTYKDAVRSTGRGVQGAGRHLHGELEGIKDFGNRRWKAAQAILNSSYTIEDANIILEDWELIRERVEHIEKIISENNEISELKKRALIVTEGSMSAEHYVAVANIIASIPSPTREAMTKKFADDFQNLYPNFDRERFVEYINGELVHDENGRVLPYRVPQDKVDAWLAANPGGGIAESA